MSTTILVADDDDGYRFPIVSLLEDHGFTVLEATNEDDVVRHARMAKIWVIDVRLPSGANEGIRAVTRLAAEQIRSDYPVIFISVLPESLAPEVRELRERSVGYEWIEKPFELELLLSRVMALLG
jgi:DNA-binding response OmpR family regulator